MELTAFVRGLKALKQPCSLEIRTFSDYTYDSALRLLHHSGSDPWVARCRQDDVPNADLWREFRSLADRHSIRLTWVLCRSKDRDARHCLGKASTAARFKLEESNGRYGDRTTVRWYKPLSRSSNAISCPRCVVTGGSYIDPAWLTITSGKIGVGKVDDSPRDPGGQREYPAISTLTSGTRRA